jgi:excisionase family DNA binding protein
MRPKPIPPDKLAIAVALRVDDTCAFLGIGRSKLYQLVQQGKITPHKPGGRVTFLRADLENFARETGLTQVNHDTE